MNSLMLFEWIIALKLKMHSILCKRNKYSDFSWAFSKWFWRAVSWLLISIKNSFALLANTSFSQVANRMPLFVKEIEYCYPSIICLMKRGRMDCRSKLTRALRYLWWPRLNSSKMFPATSLFSSLSYIFQGLTLGPSEL